MLLELTFAISKGAKMCLCMFQEIFEVCGSLFLFYMKRQTRVSVRCDGCDSAQTMHFPGALFLY